METTQEQNDLHDTLQLAATALSFSVCSVYTLAVLFILCKFRCRLDAGVLLNMLVFWLSFASKVTNWVLVDFSHLEDFEIFKSVDVGTS